MYSLTHRRRVHLVGTLPAAVSHQLSAQSREAEYLRFPAALVLATYPTSEQSVSQGLGETFGKFRSAWPRQFEGCVPRKLQMKSEPKGNRDSENAIFLL